MKQYFYKMVYDVIEIKIRPGTTQVNAPLNFKETKFFRAGNIYESERVPFDQIIFFEEKSHSGKKLFHNY